MTTEKVKGIQKNQTAMCADPQSWGKKSTG